MVTGLYASLLVLLYVQLSLKIVGLRRRHKVSIGDGGVEDLQRAIATHTNASQYIPIGLLLLLIAELNGLYLLLLHIAGIALTVGRFMHSQSIVKTDLKKRVLGMKITIFSIIGLAVVNLLLFLKQSIFSFL